MSVYLRDNRLKPVRLQYAFGSSHTLAQGETIETVPRRFPNQTCYNNHTKDSKAQTRTQARAKRDQGDLGGFPQESSIY
jgi:hypothetical protein